VDISPNGRLHLARGGRLKASRAGIENDLDYTVYI
jgi:hypothetical protein